MTDMNEPQPTGADTPADPAPPPAAAEPAPPQGGGGWRPDRSRPQIFLFGGLILAGTLAADLVRLQQMLAQRQ